MLKAVGNEEGAGQKKDNPHILVTVEGMVVNVETRGFDNGIAIIATLQTAIGIMTQEIQRQSRSNIVMPPGMGRA